MVKCIFLSVLAFVLLMPVSYGQATGNGNNLKESEALRQFRDGNYGLFMHWGLYSSLASKWKDKTYYGIAEWIKSANMANIPTEEYLKIAEEFNPSGFDAKEIVRLAKDAGMKYIVLTSKHHEGFAMFHSKVDKFNIVDATRDNDRDPIMELSKECRRQGIGLGFYYSQTQDWSAPGGLRGPKTDANGREVSFSEYFHKKCIPQVKELCTRYGKLCLLWFDTPGDIDLEEVKELYNLVKKYQPEALVSGRIGHGMGDYQTLGDMEIPERNADGLWEVCDVINDTWGYSWYDKNWKTPKQILINLLSTISRGGTYLFNVGPKADGSIPEDAAYTLRKAGEWINRYPQVVYGASASPWGHALPWGDAVIKDGKLCLLVFDRPEDNHLHLHGIKGNIGKVSLLSADRHIGLDWKQNDGWTDITLPCDINENYVNVVELELADGNLSADPGFFLSPNSDTRIGTEFASVSGCHKGYRSWMEKFGEWKFAHYIDKWEDQSWAEWELDVKEAGHYQVDLDYMGKDRVVWRVSVSDENYVQNQQAGINAYTMKPIGWLSFDRPGRYKVRVSLIEGDKEASNLRSIRFSPVR